ncbi:MAG TPA: AraC family transcriptional regulator ligand-binding domain-containing protein [Pseudomonadales bacterium]|nr:AraC family transcriptional regulator ligand-binding domain-containing protein [Pseudomonadales bacterium]
MSKRSVIGLVYMLQGIQSLGVDPTPALAKFGLSLATLDPSAEIELSLELAIFKELSGLLVEPTAGLRVADALPSVGYGVLPMVFLTCENAYEAFQAGVKYQELTYLHGQIELEVKQNVTTLLYKPEALPAEIRRLIYDGDIAGTAKLMRDLQTQLGMEGGIEEVWLPYPKPKEYKVYEAYFECPVLFDKPEGRIRISNVFLSKPFPTANKTANQLYRRQCDELLAQRQQHQGLVGKVLAHLELFNDQFPNAEEVSTSFGMSERTFRRQLAQEGASFRQLLDQARFNKAKRYLEESGKSIEVIAQHLGYSESAAFIHAFQRWAGGVTPAAYRKKLRGDSQA